MRSGRLRMCPPVCSLLCWSFGRPITVEIQRGLKTSSTPATTFGSQNGTAQNSMTNGSPTWLLKWPTGRDGGSDGTVSVLHGGKSDACVENFVAPSVPKTTTTTPGEPGSTKGKARRAPHLCRESVRQGPPFLEKPCLMPLLTLSAGISMHPL